MSEHEPGDDWSAMAAAWRSEPAPGELFDKVDPAEVRARAATFARRIRRRNWLEWAGCAFVVLAGSHIAWHAEAPLRIAGGMCMVVGALFVAWVLLARGRTRPMPSLDAPTCSILDHERGELMRQAQLLADAWRWYLLPLFPGVALIHVDELLEAHARRNIGSILTSLLELALAASIFFVVGWLNVRASRQLRARASAF